MIIHNDIYNRFGWVFALLDGKIHLVPNDIHKITVMVEYEKNVWLNDVPKLEVSDSNSNANSLS